MFKSLVPNVMVESVDNTIKYYTDIFGFELTMSVPEEGEKIWAMLQKDQVTLMLQNRDSIAEEMPEFKDIKIGASMSFFISIEGIDEIWEAVKDKINIIKKPYETFYNTKEFIFKDLNGYIITMAEHKNE